LSQTLSRPVLLLSYANGISGRLENAMQDRGMEDKVTYVAITRATHEAFITYSNMSELVGRLVV